MTPPREPRGPRRREPDESDDAGAWGRPPAGGWGPVDPYSDPPDPYDPYAGGDGRRRGEAYPRGASGTYGGEPEYGWEPPDPEPVDSRTRRRRPGPAWQPDRPASRPVARYPGPARRAARGRRRLPWIALGVAAAVVVAVLVLGFLVPGWFVTRVFDAAAVQNGVTNILSEDYGVEGVADVRCPEGVEVAAGAAFSCDATIDGDPVTVPIRVTDGNGGYEVGRPT